MQIHHRLAPFIWYQEGAEDAVAHYLKAPTRVASHAPVTTGGNLLLSLPFSRVLHGWAG